MCVTCYKTDHLYDTKHKQKYNFLQDYDNNKNPV